MDAAKCQALPSFYSDYNSKSLFISVSNEIYEKCIVTQDFCVYTHASFCSLGSCNFYLILIGISLNQFFRDKTNIKTYIQKRIVFTLCKNTDSFQVLPHQVRMYSIRLDAECSITFDGKDLKKNQAYQGNDLFGKSSKIFI